MTPPDQPYGWHDLPGALVREVERRLGRAAADFHERHGGFTGGVRGVLTTHPLGGRAPAGQVDALLVALLGYWTRSAALDAPPPLRDRCERSRRATLAWPRTRWP
ncbi:hypothetical protein [Nonomuraea sp. NPDC052265]|uniref:hypothetical protein n=1 Tax=Nonomuraea sp. NPDC052265 TaxID=3364374 RepID=UPI0037C5F44E